MNENIDLQNNGNFIKSIKEVNELLTEVKATLMINKQNLIIQPRRDRKNIDSMTQLGISKDDAAEILKRLTYKNYCWSCYDDKFPDNKEEILNIFGHEYLDEEEPIEIYIKLKVRKIKRMDKKVVCISFHQSERRLTYKYTN